MSDQEIMQQAHRLYELEGDYARQLMEKNPAYLELKAAVEKAEQGLAGGLDPARSEALAQARELLLEMTRENAFKLGYLFARHYPLDEVISIG